MKKCATVINGVEAEAFGLDEFCKRSNVSKGQLSSALAELELAGFTVNATPGQPPLKSAWKLAMLSYDGEPPSLDYMRPDVIERFTRTKAERRSTRKERRNGSQG